MILSKQKQQLSLQRMRYLLSFVCIFLLSFAAQAQERANISGKITDASNGEVLPGATIQIQGTLLGTMADIDGHFNLKDLTPGSYTLLVSFVGYTTLKVQINELKDRETKTVDVKLKAGQELSEVVVTALGIQRKEKALGYSVKELNNEDVTKAMTRNWTETLTGKVAGLTMVKSGGGPVGSNKIILRGENSLDGNSEALIVVDGVITSGASGRGTGTGGSGWNTAGETSVDFGTSLSDINPEDIESITVLKGPGAAALYGSRGANGAIIITTKSGKKRNKGLGVTISSNTDFETVSRWPDYQYEYGQGAAGQDLYYSYGTTEDGSSTRSTASAWGPKFNGQEYYQFDPETQTTGTKRKLWRPYKNNRKDFFRMGKNYTNSISIDGGNDKMSARLGFTNKIANWIVPNTGYTRNTIALAMNYQVTQKLKVASKVNYTNKSSDNLPTTGYGSQSIMYFIRGITPSADLNWFKTQWKTGEEGLVQNRPFTSYIDNPYVICHEMINASKRNQITGNVSATYEFNHFLSLMVRAALDYSTENRWQQRPKDSQYYRDGMYRTQNIYTQENNYDFLARYQRDFDKIKLSFSLGGSRMHNYYTKDELRADKLLYPNIYSFANSKIVPVAYPRKEEYATNSLYTMITANYQFVYVDLTGRNDWSSTLATQHSSDNCSFFYPSANISVIWSEALKLPEIFSLLKTRASWAQVGSGGTKPYRTAYSFDTANGFDSGLANPSNVANSSLKSLLTTSWETGLELAMFGRRLDFDLTLYKNNTTKQIVQANLDNSSGYATATLNAGEVQNRGIEIEATGKILQSKKGLNWEIFGTYSINDNKLIKLTDDLDVYTVAKGPASRGTIEAHPDGPLGALYGLGYKRSPDRQIVYENGYALLSEEAKYLGNTTPNCRASIGTTLRYKQFSLNLLFDGQFGGVGYSATHAVLCEEGKLKKTLPGRYNGIIGEGVMMNADGTFRQNDVMASDIQRYYNSHFTRDNVEANTFKTDFIKLREARLDFTVPASFLNKISIQKCVVGIYGRDLFTWTNWPAFDPEFGTLNGSDIVGGFETAQFPGTRTFGVNVNLSF